MTPPPVVVGLTATALAASVSLLGLGLFAVVSAAHLMRYMESRRPGPDRLAEVVKKRWLLYPVPIIAAGALLINKTGWVILAAAAGFLLLLYVLFG